MENALIQVQELNPARLFSSSEDIDAIIQEIERKALDGFEPDLTTATGRKKIASQAHKVARSKTLLDEAGKNLVADLKSQVKTVDAERKRLRDGLDDLKARVRQPLTEWEKAEAERQERERIAAEIDAAHEAAIEENILFNERREMERKIAEMEAAEAERRAQEDAARKEAERIEREKRIAAEAAEKARREAEEADRRRWEAAERERIRKEEEARREAEAAEKARREAEEAERQERERVERERQAEMDRMKAEAEAREAAERQRQEDEAQRLADQEHCANVESGIKAALIGLGCYPSIVVDDIIDAIKAGDVPGLRIEY